MALFHQPVLLHEVITYLDPKPNQNFIDCTIGGAGHSLEILKRNGPQGKLLGIELDAATFALAAKRLQSFQPRVILVRDSFANLERIVLENKFDQVRGILLDLGLSSIALENSGRGFSFQRNEPLDMRFGSSGERAVEIVQSRSARELAKIFREYGEEKRAYPIAQAIVQAREQKAIRTTGDLVKIIISGKERNQNPSPPASLEAKRWRAGQPPLRKGRGIHPATKVFQALRIAVNRELEALEQVLPQALKILEPGGRLVIISFHSLEDRIVKNFFRKEARDCLCPPETPVCVCKHQKQLKILTKKPVKSTLKEINQNSRARSATLRAARKKNLD